MRDLFGTCPKETGCCSRRGKAKVNYKAGNAWVTVESAPKGRKQVSLSQQLVAAVKQARYQSTINYVLKIQGMTCKDCEPPIQQAVAKMLGVADAAWLGEAGPGPSYLDEGSGGPENDFTNRNTTFMTWNLIHLARMIKDAGGIPAHGNQRSQWDAGCRFDFPNPEHR